MVRRSWFRLIIVLVIAFAAVDGVIAILNLHAGLAILIFTLVIASIIFYVVRHYKSDLLRLLIPYSMDHSQIQPELVRKIP